MSAAAAAVSAMIGVWLLVAPSVLGYDGVAASIHRIAGPIAVSFGVIALWRVVRAVLRANALAGLLTALAAAFVDGPISTVNAVVAGAVLATLALLPIRGGDTFAGGWIGLTRDDS